MLRRDGEPSRARHRLCGDAPESVHPFSTRISSSPFQPGASHLTYSLLLTVWVTTSFAALMAASWVAKRHSPLGPTHSAPKQSEIIQFIFVSDLVGGCATNAARFNEASVVTPVIRGRSLRSLVPYQSWESLGKVRLSQTKD